MDEPTVKALVGAVGISKGYASDILRDKKSPSRSLAIYIFRKTGWRHRLIRDLTERQIRVLEDVEPWRPVPERAA